MCDYLCGHLRHDSGSTTSLELHRRGSARRRPFVKISDFSAVTGLDPVSVSALINARLLVRSRNGQLTPNQWSVGLPPIGRTCSPR
jgi:hypothetical protein